ncbi:hypothetical protein [Leptotrichia sp. oral taxon 212]|uniref:hypothetical protein n=1 Tax=Leptotrichia sp. oral taxon 212 TaxID=712357 RepID=UPI0006A9673D|nr:hypothetical protein [Leptotrichia sp. oral taxon 212]ALA95644.1 hypothetical protein AMK43_06000 [Leptotrichia sp. oral taxon 212]
MTSTLAFLSILIIFMRLYSIFGITFLTDKKAKFAERITIFLLIFEISVIFLHLFFNSLRTLLPPVLIFLKTTQYQFLIFKNISIEGILYTISDIVLLLTFNFISDTVKSFNRIFLTYIFLINALLGIITLLF